MQVAVVDGRRLSGGGGGRGGGVRGRRGDRDVRMVRVVGGDVGRVALLITAARGACRRRGWRWHR